MTKEVPHVYIALAEVVKTLDVDKDSVLPANMGKSSYRTTEAITAAVRALFEKENLILIPNEHVIESGAQEIKDRVTYYSVIVGTYEIVSLKDGSSRSEERRVGKR